MHVTLKFILRKPINETIKFICSTIHSGGKQYQIKQSILLGFKEKKRLKKKSPDVLRKIILCFNYQRAISFRMRKD